jgi:hypothetical protein
MQVSFSSYGNTENKYKVRSDIDILLSSGAVNLSEPTIQLTTCSPDVDVVINGQGGICTSCNLLFLSRSSLMGHLEKCSPGNNIFTKENKTYDSCEEYSDKSKKKSKGPRLIVKSN